MQFPYGYSSYNSLENLKKEYRSIKIRKYLLFYTINESKKTITIIRILHQKMDIVNYIE